MHLRPLDPESTIPLCDADATVEGAPPRGRLKDDLKRRLDELAALHRKLRADGRFAVLVILQGRDASGKDGTVRRVFGACDPEGLVVANFKEPTPLELRHDFLWRVHRDVPPSGALGVFNRSQYEDVVAVRVRGLVPRDVWQARYDAINDFERMLVHNRCIVLKFFLHISRDEQRRRLLKRLERPDKNWKFSERDVVERRLWDAYTEAYRDMLRRCSTDEAPWYVVPADDKKIRDYLIAGTVVRAMRGLDLEYPAADPNLVLAAEQALGL